MAVDFSEHRVRKAILSAEEALFKIKNWCAYQERSQLETRRKLLQYGLSSTEVEQIVAVLISENFVNEERFAMAFAGGKFRIKRWGRNKIRMELKKHQVSDYSINKALKAIAGDDYEEVLKQVVEKKLAALKSNDRRKNFYSVLSYAVSRGFEGDLVTDLLNQLLENK